jgi:hypothetical protein
MDAIYSLTAIEAIRLLKARYFRGVDTGDGSLVRSVLAEDCILDYTDCFLDPLTGHDHFPALSLIMRGRAAYSGNGLAQIGIVSAHYGPNCEIVIDNATSARGIWSMTDRLVMPEGSPVRELIGHGHYHETYVRIGDDWLIKTLRIVRTRVEAVHAA